MSAWQFSRMLYVTERHGWTWASACRTNSYDPGPFETTHSSASADDRPWSVGQHLRCQRVRARLAERRAAHSLTAPGRVRVFHVRGANSDDAAGDRNYLVLAKRTVIMNDIRLRGLSVGGSDAAGRKNPHNHAQTARNLQRSLRNAAAGARLIQADGLDSQSAADVAASLADALEELCRLKRRLDRRIRREQGRSEEPGL
jgi:hypothetical protein